MNRTPCLGARISALADGSLSPDAEARALAHTLACSRCRQALAAERLVRQALQGSPSPDPSARLVDDLLAMAGPGGLLPPKRQIGPGMTPPTVSFAALPPVPRSSRRPLMMVAAAIALGATVGAGQALAPAEPPPVASLVRDSQTSATPSTQVSALSITPSAPSSSRQPAPLDAQDAIGSASVRAAFADGSRSLRNATLWIADRWVRTSSFPSSPRLPQGR
ncbi:MAG: anti-sigma factor family protein [Actinomycetota bacterium]